jgi:hypothetical protein
MSRFKIGDKVIVPAGVKVLLDKAWPERVGDRVATVVELVPEGKIMVEFENGVREQRPETAVRLQT